MTDPHLPETACGQISLQRWLLRFAALVQFTGLPGAILPRAAVENLSWLMGFGRPALDPLTIYISGNAGYVFVAVGILVWAISNDVVRYRPLVILCGWLYLIGAPIYLSIDLQCPLPWWWIAADTVGCVLIGGGILWACRRRALSPGPARSARRRAPWEV